MKANTLAARAGVLALAGALIAFGGIPSGANEGEVTTKPYNSGPVEDAYVSFVTSKAPVASDVADSGYGSQGFHHGLPETSFAPRVEPVAGGAEAMTDAFAVDMIPYVADPDYGSRGIEHWMPNYYQAD